MTANYRFVTSASPWGGESEVPCDLGAPMLSVTGAGAAFQTPEDVTADFTSPASLATAGRAIANAFDTLLETLD